MVIRWYSALMARRPVLTSAVSTGLLFSAGDVIAQQAVEQRGLGQHDYSRTARAGGYGTLIFGPAVVLWYSSVARVSVRLPTGATQPTFLNSTLPSTLARVGLDQAVFTPAHLACFFSWLVLTQPASWTTATRAPADTPATAASSSGAHAALGAAAESVRANFPAAYRANLAIWPAVQMVNFWLVPLQWRVMTVNLVALGWNTYLSWVGSGRKQQTGSKLTGKD